GAEFEGKLVPESQLVAKWFNEWKNAGALDPGLEIVALEPCADTHDEAVHVKQLASGRGWHHLLLVTSANHLRRASALFRTQGLEVSPVPCNFLTNVSTAPSPNVFGVP